MAKLSIALDQRRQKENGMYPIKLKISQNQKASFIPLGIDVLPTAWIGRDILMSIKSSSPNSKMINRRIYDKYIFYADKLTDINNSGRINLMTATDIKDYLLSQVNEYYSNNTFTDHFDTFTARKTAKSTKDTYLHTKDTIEAYCGANCHKLAFEDVTVKWLKEFENYLIKKGSSTNTRWGHFKHIKAVFNSAIDEEVIGQELYPFRKFKFKQEFTNPESLTIEQLKEVTIRNNTSCIIIIPVKSVFGFTYVHFM